MEIAIIPDYSKEGAFELAKEIAKWLKDRSISPVAAYGNSTDKALLISGDGFTMKTSRELAQYNIPFLVVNFGRKGFLAVARKDNWQEVLEKVLDGRYTIDRRPILAVSHFDAKGGVRNFEAAGNVYIRHRAYLILFTVSIDGKVVYKELGGDGVIVANVTGATAYNLAAKGVIITSGLVVSPICPHRLDVASLPVSKSAKKIEIVYHGRNNDQRDDEGCLLFLDSEKYPILPGERLEIRESGKEAAFITQEGFSWIESLQEKMGLSR